MVSSLYIQYIKRADYLFEGMSGNMSINFSGFGTCMAEEFLDIAQIRSVFKKMRGEGVS